MRGKGYLRFLAPWGALALSALLAVLAWRATRDNAERRRTHEFGSAAEYTYTQVNGRLQQYDAALDAACLLFAASDSVEPHEWQTFIAGLRLPERCPEVIDIALLAAGARAAPWAVQYHWRGEPDWLDAVRSQPAQVEEAPPAARDAFFRVSASETARHALFVQPLWSEGGAAPAGWAAIRLDGEALGAVLHNHSHAPLRVRLTQTDEDGPHLVFDSHPSLAEDSEAQTCDLPIAWLGKPLSLHVTALPHPAGAGFSWAIVVFALGLGAAVLVFVFIMASQRAQRRAERRADERTAALRQREEELERYSTALLQANEALELHSMSALQATHAKSLFLANTSHELRTPLTVILGFAEVLRGETLARQTHDEAVDAILRSAAHLLQLIDDLLDLSKIEAGTMTVAVEPCALPPLLDEVVGMVEGQARAKGLTLAVDRPPTLPAIVATDPRRLRQILINLLVNAIKFTERGGVHLAVRMGGVPEKATLECAVRDTGIGMTAQQLGRLFHPFAQGDRQIGTRFGGTGLGLSISRRLAELLGGALTVESALGEGSTFRLSLPVGDLTVVRHAGPVGTTTLLPQAAVAERSLEGRRLLLAEDSPDNRRLLGLVLGKAGVLLTAVENGQQACNAAWAAVAEGQAFDLILMDMEMPVLDGFAATRQLRDRGYRGRIVALTARAMHEDAQRCLEAGCDDYATKPIRRDTLLDLVARHTQATAALPIG